MKARKAPAPFVVIYTAAVAGAVAVLAADVLVGAAVLLTVCTVGAVYCLVQAERAQARYRRLLEAKAATRPWSEADVLADEAALIEARRARLAESMSRTVREHYGTPTAPQRVVIDRHEPIREAS